MNANKFFLDDLWIRNKLEKQVKELENNSLEILKEFSPGQKISSTEKVMKVKNESDFFKILAQEIESAENSVYGFTKASKEELKPIGDPCDNTNIINDENLKDQSALSSKNLYCTAIKEYREIVSKNK